MRTTSPPRENNIKNGKIGYIKLLIRGAKESGSASSETQIYPPKATKIQKFYEKTEKSRYQKIGRFLQKLVFTVLTDNSTCREALCPETGKGKSRGKSRGGSLES